MTATRQVTNQANAQHSTGPRTPEGKATVSQNANNHNLTGRLQIRADEQAAFQQFETAHRNQIQPASPLEQTVFEQLIAAAWNLRRIETMEAGKLEQIADEAIAKQLDRLARYRSQHQRAFHRALRELKALQTAREILERQTDQTKTTFAPLADLGRVRKAGFVLSTRAEMLNKALETYLFSPPPGQTTA
jgi:hypothetical protein